MFPHEEYLLKAMRCTDFRMIGLIGDLGRLYISTMADRTVEGDFQKVLQIGEAIKRCSQEIANIQGDSPVCGGHADDIVL